MTDILTVALIVAITAFFKKQLKLTGWRVLLATLVVAMVVGLAPLAAASFPLLAPWIERVILVVTLFLAAAGSYDLTVDIKQK
jgi:uncharacterized membrane-anchored protein